MDRFIGKVRLIGQFSNNSLKSNMDRFIVPNARRIVSTKPCLKSNMDRFIVCRFRR